MNDDNSISNDNTKDAVVVISNDLYAGDVVNKVARAALNNRIDRMKLRSQTLNDLGCNQLDLHVWFHQDCPIKSCNYNQDNWMMRGSCCNPECPQDSKAKLKAHNIIHDLLDQST